ncbi:MAG: hypothetical protein ABIJ86_06120 [Spirochaetota bacterium]
MPSWKIYTKKLWNLVGNMGYRKYLAHYGVDHFLIDEEKVKDEARFDGIWIPTTIMADPVPDIAWHCKEMESRLVEWSQS